MKFKILQQQTHYQNFFRLEEYTLQHELFNGGWSVPLKREIFERGNAVAVLLHDPQADTLLLLEQFRPGAALRNPQDAWMIEIVAGMVEDGESKADVARREAQEEAGCNVDELEFIMDYYPSAGGSTEIVSLYYAAIDLSKVKAGVHGLADEHEDIRINIVPRQQALDWLRAGRIQASLAIIALQWLALEKPVPNQT